MGYSALATANMSSESVSHIKRMVKRLIEKHGSPLAFTEAAYGALARKTLAHPDKVYYALSMLNLPPGRCLVQSADIEAIKTDADGLDLWANSDQVYRNKKMAEIFSR
jgi:hypothetical protein